MRTIVSPVSRRERWNFKVINIKFIKRAKVKFKERLEGGETDHILLTNESPPQGPHSLARWAAAQEQRPLSLCPLAFPALRSPSVRGESWA